MSDKSPANTLNVQNAMATAEKHFQAGRLGDAENLLRAALKVQPNNADALYALALVAYAAKKPDAAIALLEEAIEINPNAARFHINLSAIYAQAGRHDEAAEHGRIAVTLRPQSSEAHNNYGVALSHRNDFEGAIAQFDAAIQLDPRNADAFCNRAGLLFRTGKLDDAERDARQAFGADSTKPAPQNILASVLVSKGDYLQAEDTARHLLKAVPGNLEGMLNLIAALRGQRKYDAALAIAQQTLQLFPDNIDAACMAANIQMDRRQFDVAAKLVEQALAVNPDHAETVVAQARLLIETQQPHEGAAAARRAASLEPRHAEAFNLLGSALRELGQFDEAVLAFERCLAIRPDHYGAYANLAEAKKFRSNADVHIQKMQALLDAQGRSEQTAESRMHLHFALGKALEDAGEYDSAFSHFSQACEIKKQKGSYSEPETLEFFERVKREFTPEKIKLRQGRGHASRVPIFVFGMPRSGTTLIEQILSSHPEVHGAGEVRVVHDAALELRNRLPGQRGFPEFMQNASAADLEYFGSRVAQGLSRFAPAKPRVTNKMTSNFYFLGLLHAALPEAKFIHARRNAVDTCVSCFSKHFVAEVGYSYDLQQLGRYYKAYDALMSYWKGVLPADAFLDVRYEDMIDDVEHQSQRILAYCQLSWDPQVLSFHQNTRPVMTASAMQVRQPIYSSSVSRWRRYESHLAPLLTELGDLAQ